MQWAFPSLSNDNCAAWEIVLNDYKLPGEMFICFAAQETEMLEKCANFCVKVRHRSVKRRKLRTILLKH